MSVIKVLKTILPNLSNSINASIVFLSTVAVSKGMPFHSSVASSKGAIEGLAKSLAAEFAPKIRVNGISPGPTLKSTNQTDKQFLSQIARTPLKRQVELDEINLAIEYLIKNKSVTGDVLTIDSGQSLGWAHSKSRVFSTD